MLHSLMMVMQNSSQLNDFKVNIYNFWGMESVTTGKKLYGTMGV